MYCPPLFTSLLFHTIPRFSSHDKMPNEILDQLRTVGVDFTTKNDMIERKRIFFRLRCHLFLMSTKVFIDQLRIKTIL